MGKCVLPAAYVSENAFHAVWYIGSPEIGECALRSEVIILYTRIPKRRILVTYLRCTIGRWNIDLDSEEGREAFRLIDTEGVRVFREQPGFVRYRLMLADPTTTIAIAEWESEELGKPGAQRYREWLRSSGIAQKLSLETYDGEVVVAS
jgi:hypothetical protein